MTDADVAVIGAGYVGLTTAACLCALGHRVSCVDIDDDKVAALRRGRVGLAEPRLAELVRAGLDARRLAFTTDWRPVAEAGRVLLCLPTPMSADGRADLRAVESVLPRLASLVPEHAVVITKSTVPVGTTRRIAQALARPDVSTVSNPEFLREGHAVRDFFHPDRIVVGADDEHAAVAVAALYEGIDAPVVHTDPDSAELAKYAANAFLAMKISYANTLDALCERLGADVGDVARTVGLDSRIGPAGLAPGPGWGGSCLPKDTAALVRIAESAGADLDLVRAAIAVNAKQRERMVTKVREAATGDPDGCLRGMRICVLGLTFKAGTDDLRDSPAVAIAADLAAEGAVLTGYDPAVPAAERERVGPVRVVDDPYLAAEGAACVAVLTEWPEFGDLDLSRIAAVSADAAVVDTRKILKGS